MELDEIIAVLREHGLSVREIAAVTEVPKSTVHRLLNKYGIRIVRRYTDTVAGHELVMIHFPYTFFCPVCGIEQNHAWVCLRCKVFVPAECEENEVCMKGFNITEFVWGKRLLT